MDIIAVSMKYNDEGPPGWCREDLQNGGRVNMKNTVKARYFLKATVIIAIMLAFIAPSIGIASDLITDKKIDTKEDMFQQSETITPQLEDEKLDRGSLISSEYINNNEIIISFKMSDFIQTQDDVKGEKYTCLRIPSAGSTGKIGKPQLPCASGLFAVPTDMISFKIIETKVMESQHVGKVYPSQEPQFDGLNMNLQPV